ncbi:uteroglobin [Eulemur rufifrons]|uniref:uteroglobin n=1 Tax=Eulemur rufifrons TaxID=859984 RepID=UPI0037430B33
MKLLAVTLTLVTLALCCSSASAKVCPNFLQILESLFRSTLPSFETVLEIFSPDQDMRDAGIELQKLADTLPEKARVSIIKFTEKVVQNSTCD